MANGPNIFQMLLVYTVILVARSFCSVARQRYTSCTTIAAYDNIEKIFVRYSEKKNDANEAECADAFVSYANMIS